MGLAQTFQFKCDRTELEELLLRLEYNKIDQDRFGKSRTGMQIDIKITQEGLIMHRSGDYFEDLGMLVEAIGEISSKLSISDF